MRVREYLYTSWLYVMSTCVSMYGFRSQIQTWSVLFRFAGERIMGISLVNLKEKKKVFVTVSREVQKSS